MADQLDRHGVDARVAGAARAAASVGQLAVVARAAGCGGRRAISAATRWKLSSSHSAAGVTNSPAVDVVGQRAVGRAQHAGVVVEAREDAARARRGLGIDGEAGRERQRPLLEPLDAQQLVAQRLLELTPALPRSRRSRAWSISEQLPYVSTDCPNPSTCPSRSRTANSSIKHLVKIST